jgi:hypothetical protein
LEGKYEKGKRKKRKMRKTKGKGEIEKLIWTYRGRGKKLSSKGKYDFLTGIL